MTRLPEGMATLNGVSPRLASKDATEAGGGPVAGEDRTPEQIDDTDDADLQADLLAAIRRGGPQPGPVLGPYGAALTESEVDLIHQMAHHISHLHRVNQALANGILAIRNREMRKEEVIEKMKLEIGDRRSQVAA